MDVELLEVSLIPAVQTGCRGHRGMGCGDMAS